MIKLYRAGFNVVLVDSAKKPLSSWGADKRVELKKLIKILPKAFGIAIVGGFENPFKPVNVLMLIDIDRLSILEKIPGLKKLVEKTVSWYTGPRCFRCEGKDLETSGSGFKCRICGSEFPIDKAKRGIGALVNVDVYEKYIKGTLRFGDVELLAKNYQLIPPSIHPTGIRYALRALAPPGMGKSFFQARRGKNI
jgi:hypothetical protein